MMLIIRCLLIIPAVLLSWCLTAPIARPNEDNWLYQIAYEEGWWGPKLASGLLCFAIIIAVGACLGLLYRRSPYLLGSIAVAAYIVGNFIGIGYATTFDEFMEPHVFGTLVLGMTVGVSMCFADMLAGHQVDVVGDGN